MDLIKSPSSVKSDEYFSAVEDHDDENKKSSKKLFSDNDDDNKTPLALALDRLCEASQNAIVIERAYAAANPPRDEEEDDPKFANNLWKDVPALANKLEKARSGLQQAWSDAQEAHDEECKKQQCQDDDDDYYHEEYYEESDDDDDEIDVPEIDFGRAIDLNAEVTLELREQIGDEAKQDEEKSEGSDSSDNDNDSDVMPPEEFRSMYMDMMTEAFGDDLQQLDRQSDGDVEILVDALQSGIDLLGPDEKNRRSFFASLGYPQKEKDDMEVDKNDEDENSSWTVHKRRQKALGYIVEPQSVMGGTQ